MNSELARQHEAHKARMARMAVHQGLAKKISPPVDNDNTEAAECETTTVVEFVSLPKRRSTMIVEEGCEKHKVTVKAVRGPSRTMPLVIARNEIAYRLYDECENLSLSQIGKILNRDHTTCLHGIRQHALRNDLPLPRGMVWERAA